MKYKVLVKNKTIINNAVEADIKKILNKNGWKEVNKNFDYLFIIAGDGTFLKSLQNYYKDNKSIVFVPIKDSAIGYYYEYNIKNYKKLLEKLVLEKYKVDKISLLEIDLDNKKQKIYALNEIKIVNYIKPIKVKIYVNNNFFMTSNGTGLVIASNNGSSGFIKSVNGAIMMLNSSLLQFKEINPVINLNQNRLTNSFILANDNFIKLEIQNNDDFEIIVDNSKIEKNNNKTLLIKYSADNLLVLKELENLENKINRIKKIFIKE